jgi:phospholipase/carboxylesterase
MDGDGRSLMVWGRTSPPKTLHLILLHGWGASGDDLLPLGQALIEAMAPSDEAVTLTALEAPDAHPAGGGARQWYDLNAAEWPGIPVAVANLGQRLDGAIAEAGSEAVVVLGFSQGAAMALETAMARPCAAVIACSGYPHPGWSLDGTMDVPLLVLHGRDDQVVPVAAAEAIASRVAAAGGRVDCHIVSGGHTIGTEAVQHMAQFLDSLGLMNRGSSS